MSKSIYNNLIVKMSRYARGLRGRTDGRAGGYKQSRRRPASRLVCIVFTLGLSLSLIRFCPHLA